MRVLDPKSLSGFQPAGGCSQVTIVFPSLRQARNKVKVTEALRRQQEVVPFGLGNRKEGEEEDNKEKCLEEVGFVHTFQASPQIV